MKIAGYLKTSLLDWPGEVASVIWTVGCNFRCPWCHNRDLIEGKNLKLVNEEELIDDLKKRKKWIDGLVITGGEPTLQPDLINFCEKIKKIGLKIKLDTNGSRPEMLGKLIMGAGNHPPVLDYVAMDIKVDWDNYKIVGADNDLPVLGADNDLPVQKSAKLIINSGIDYEFRTTVVPRIHNREVLMKMAKRIKSLDRWVWQNFRPMNCLDKQWEEERGYREKEIRKLRSAIDERIGLRGW